MSIPSEWVASFPTVPPAFVKELFDNFATQVDAWYVHDWEKVGMKAGKIAEISFSILDGRSTGTYAPQAFKPKNFLAACMALENQAHLSRSLRIQIPRVLIGMYELRNNRSVGHVGSPVQPNRLDGEYFFRSSKWIVCELSRAICEEEGVTGAEAFYSEVNTSEVPLIWESDDLVRVLRPSMAYADKVCVVLAHFSKWTEVRVLQRAVEHLNITHFRKRVLEKLHKDKLIEYDGARQRTLILPAGVRRARMLHDAT